MWHEKLFLAALIGTICCLIFVVFFVIKNKTSSTSISFVMWVVFSFIMLFLEPFIFSPTKNISLDRLIWFGTYAAVDVFAIYFINKIHKICKIDLSRESLLICSSYFVLLLLQVGRYIDKQIFDGDLIGSIYKNGVPTINILTWAFIISVVVINQAKKNKEFKNV